MTWLLLFLVIFGPPGQQICTSVFSRKTTGGTFCYGGLVSLCAGLFFTLTHGGISFSVQYLLPAVFLAVIYASGTLFSFLSLGAGPFARTSLIISYSLLVPTFYGILFLGDPVTVKFIIALILLSVSLWLTNHEKSDAKVSTVWVILVVLAFFGNGMYSVVTKAEQLVYGADTLNNITAIALFMASAILFTVSLFTNERKTVGKTLLTALPYAAVCGLLNGLTNFLVILLNEKIPVSVISPVIAGGGLVIAFVYSVLFAKEKFTKTQFCGFLFGLVSLVLFNI